ncbi:MAG: DUF2470 domain-containing protein [Pseudomonadota bacterium]
MGIPVNVQNENSQHIQNAKTLLRCERYCRINNIEIDRELIALERLSCASDLDGALLVAIDKKTAPIFESSSDTSLSVILGVSPQLHLICSIEKLSIEMYRLCDQRFRMQHGSTDDRKLVRLLPNSAKLFEGGEAIEITGEKLLTQSGIGLREMERRAVDHMNEDHLDAVGLYAEALLNQPAGAWRMASLDMDGLDLINGSQGVRLWFDPPLKHPKEIKERLVQLVREARKKS